MQKLFLPQGHLFHTSRPFPDHSVPLDYPEWKGHGLMTEQTKNAPPQGERAGWLLLNNNQNDQSHRQKDISIHPHQVGSFLKILQGCLIVLRQKLAAFWVHLKDKRESHLLAIRNGRYGRRYEVTGFINFTQYPRRECDCAHLAEESHSVCVPRVGSLVEVVVSPLLERRQQKWI